MSKKNPRYLTASELARTLGRNRKAIVRWAEAGEIPSWKTPGGFHQFDVDAVKRTLGIVGDETTVGTGELARILGKDHRTILRWVETGKLPVAWTSPTGQRRYDPQEVAEALGIVA